MTSIEKVIEHRFIEAAEIARRLPMGRIFPSSVSGIWPEYRLTVAEMYQWGGERFAEHRSEFWSRRRLVPSAAAISRHDEVMVWVAFISEPEERKLVWAYAWCKAEARSFSRWCRDRGVGREQAYRRLKRSFRAIASGAHTDLPSMTDFAADEVLQLHRQSATHDGMLAERDDEPATSPTSMMTERPGDNPDERDFSWARKQAEREARKRKMLEHL